MSKSDQAGDKKRARQSLAEAFHRGNKMQAQESDETANIEVGDFLSELVTAIRFRMKTGLTEGDWIEDPERYFTDGRVFAEEEAVSSEVKLQITVSLDASTSMWSSGNIMRYAGPTFITLDRIIRKACLDLPEGSVHYAPFIFHSSRRTRSTPSRSAGS
jgi:hypothetical protein